MHAVLTVYVVRKNSTQVYRGEMLYEVGEHHPESAVVTVSLPRICGIRRHSAVYLWEVKQDGSSVFEGVNLFLSGKRYSQRMLMR